MAEILAEVADALVGGAPFLGQLNPAEVAHHLLVVHHRVEALLVGVVPVAHDQPSGLGDYLTH